ncbi:MAG TPA: NUDIX hydrolase [Chitinophagaceae bacterium]|jgi:8-oxo-dGTP pyrophosphatase MutT (NUDIX family)|nr:NUDIX hydrolase [Chitinophagaceae bacterium]
MANLRWKLLSSQYLFHDLWFKVRKEKCETPQGKLVDPYYVYEFPTWVCAVPVTADGKIVMVRQYRHALGEVCLELPGGCVDPTDSDFEQAIARELKEETGYAFEHYEYLGRISANPSTNNNLLHMFLAREGKKVAEQQLDGNEEIEVELYSIDELKQLLRENKIIQSMHVSCILYAFERLGVLKY